MKWLLILLVVLGGIWWLRQSRRKGQPGGANRGAASTASPQAMTRCAQCGVHLPRADAIAGAQGDYCSLAHRQQHED